MIGEDGNPLLDVNGNTHWYQLPLVPWWGDLPNRWNPQDLSNWQVPELYYLNSSNQAPAQTYFSSVTISKIIGEKNISLVDIGQ
ncbi:MAG: hypothetical protein NT150_12060 [Bacteroidetes bacterium]|nr:hypothetical protein [Bacteroidota bacterium]